MTEYRQELTTEDMRERFAALLAAITDIRDSNGGSQGYFLSLSAIIEWAKLPEDSTHD